MHNAAVGEDYLGSHGLLSAGVHVAEFVEISEHDHALSLGRSQVSIKSLPEASLFQVANGEWALRCNMRRSEALHGVAFAQDRDPALARCYKRCRFLGSLAVFHQHVVSGEHVRGGVSREIAIQKERVKRRELLHRGEQCVRFTDRMAVVSDQAVLVKMAGTVCSRHRVGNSSDFHVVSQHAVGCQCLVAFRSGTENYTQAVACGTGGECQNSAALVDFGLCGFLTDLHSENLCGRVLAVDQVVAAYGPDRLVESFTHYFVPPLVWL